MASTNLEKKAALELRDARCQRDAADQRRRQAEADFEKWDAVVQALSRLLGEASDPDAAPTTTHKRRPTKRVEQRLRASVAALRAAGGPLSPTELCEALQARGVAVDRQKVQDMLRGPYGEELFISDGEGRWALRPSGPAANSNYALGA